ncbi:hypothetical protein SETIT_6G048300v2 [Setaria italica]|uniref:Uncharacterized protein n=2 Tax=Setaria TaxID=4554 RepID=A0A368RI41_SETIT|nr:hypothetical protein SETIT_6G048300v2 [Setaria italica]
MWRWPAAQAGRTPTARRNGSTIQIAAPGFLRSTIQNYHTTPQYSFPPSRINRHL